MKKYINEFKQLSLYKINDLNFNIIKRQIEVFWFCTTLPDNSYFPYKKMKFVDYIILYFSSIIPLIWWFLWALYIQRKLNWETLILDKNIKNEEIIKIINEDIPNMNPIFFYKIPYTMIFLFFSFLIYFIYDIHIYIIFSLIFYIFLTTDLPKIVITRIIIYFQKRKTENFRKFSKKMINFTNNVIIMEKDIENWKINNDIGRRLGRSTIILLELALKWKKIINNDYFKNVMLELFSIYESIFYNIDKLKQWNLNIENRNIKLAKVRYWITEEKYENIKKDFLKTKQTILKNF